MPDRGLDPGARGSRGDVKTKTRPGAEEAARLYQEHARPLRAFLRVRLADPAAADDALQETFLTAIRQGLPPGPPGPWLFGIARRKALKQAERRGAGGGLREEAAPAREAGPVDALDRDERRARVQGAVGALPPDQREVLVLRYTGGLSYPEIAERLEVPVSTVQGRLKRARHALRRQLVGEVEA